MMLANAAFWAALAAVLTFAGKLVYDVEARRYDYWETRRSVIVRFRTDVELTLKDLNEQLPGLDLIVYRRKMVAQINFHAVRNRKFRMFGAEATDTRVQTLMADYLVTLPVNSQRLVAEAILRDRQMRALYAAMQSDAFENLSRQRKIAAFDQWLKTAQKLAQALGLMMEDMDAWSINHRTLPGRLFGWDPEAR